MLLCCVPRSSVQALVNQSLPCKVYVEFGLHTQMTESMAIVDTVSCVHCTVHTNSNSFLTHFSYIELIQWFLTMAYNMCAHVR